MRLRDDLKVLATEAPPPPPVDLLLRRAKTIRNRRAVLTPAMAVVAVLMFTITYLSRVDGGGPAVEVTFWIQHPSAPWNELETVDPAPELIRVAGIIEQRARLAGLRHPHARVQDTWIVLEFDGDGPRVDLHQLAAPGDVQVRKVVEIVYLPHGETITAVSPTPRTPPAGKEASTLDELITKLGPQVYARADALRAVGEPELFPGFETLTAREVALLPPLIQLYVPTIPCAKIVPPLPLPHGLQTVLCSSEEKLLLDPAKFTGEQVEDAVAKKVPVAPEFYQVQLRLNKIGQQAFTSVSSVAASGEGCDAGKGNDGHCLLAMVVDGEVLSAPEILRTLRSDEAVFGSFKSEAEARLTAAKIGPRELPPGVKLAG